MFHYKKYQWLLTELHHHKASIKILNITFVNNSSVLCSFSTGPDGILSCNPKKPALLKDYLEHFLTKKLSSESFDISKPILYIVFPTYKKQLTLTELKEMLKRDSKLSSVKSIIFIQDLQHNYSIYYSAEANFDGEGLKTILYRKDFNQPDYVYKDSKYIQLAMNLVKYLVSFIEGIVNKNIFRLFFEFIVDQNFSPIVLCVNKIKLVDPKIVALNKGVDVDELETHVLRKNDFKMKVFEWIPSIVKEPEPDATSPTPVNTSLTTSIFKHFIKKFLTGEKFKRKTVKKKLSSKTFGYLSPTGSLVLDKIKADTPAKLKLQQTRSPSWINSIPVTIRNSASAGDSMKLPNLKHQSASNSFKNLSYLNSFKPNNTLIRFLKDEEERILEKKSRRILSFQLENFIESSEASPQKKKKLKNKIYKKVKKRILPKKVNSPYLKIQTIK